MGDAAKSCSLPDAANWHGVEGTQSLAQSFLFIFFELFEILMLQDSSYFSHNPWLISQLKSIPFGRLMKMCLVMVTMIALTL